MAVQSPYLELSQESADRFCSFVLDGGYGDVPEAVLHRARLQLLDLIGVAASSIQTPLSRIIRDHAVAMFGAGNRPARIMFDGRGASPAGAAMAGGMSIDAVDAHDGFAPTKGHIGVTVLPDSRKPSMSSSVRSTRRPAVTATDPKSRLVIA